uniref:C2H2-type domain-containing protein n=1 Tax=Anopheles dirus TaxID=7168 RepID=A0A182NP50_9DIPT
MDQDSLDSASENPTKLEVKNEEHEDEQKPVEEEKHKEPDAAETATCRHCGEEFPGKKLLNFHTKSDHADDDTLPKIRKCFFCPKAYSSYELLDYHLNFHPQKVWQCPHCDKETKKKALFIDHLRIHANEGYYECEECGESFPAMKQLATHSRTHQGKRVGNRAASKKNDLKTHQKRNICGQNFDITKLLASHPRTICIKSPPRTEPEEEPGQVLIELEQTLDVIPEAYATVTSETDSTGELVFRVNWSTQGECFATPKLSAVPLVLLHRSLLPLAGLLLLAGDLRSSSDRGLRLRRSRSSR